MTSGSKTHIERLCLALVLALTLALAIASPSAWAFEVPDLMRLLAQQKSGEARFTEQRFVRGLEGPLQASGVLDFSPPDRMTRRTLSPRPETMSVDGNTLTLTRSGRTRTMTLDSVPELLGLVESMRSTLSGDSRTLSRYFRMKVSGSADDWSLDLTPIEDRLAAQVRSVRMSGRKGEVLGVDMEFVGGDRSSMTISPVSPARAKP
ncbi:MAG: outer membrane lipoprotein carrier protein LolA [Gammaproteobacteria bacterium]|nr:outer membrane lipoprotein carrier protein LolA [Gammaproteobacteria bacterium]MBU1440000.1 outer membrane lipoprotein carrier protein LolA [Gammaproteobacteria bacterium]MBU2285526.1 outer membrane lipoprotein carrier protein LolA [Gammaproteobacteria bacterium]MBU2410850.1 outer membrane lipoprotein carrier protein LolA [Gammaproteobacteria bacterium]